MNETDSVFEKEDFLVDVPYVEPLFWEVLMLYPWFEGLMAYERMIWKDLMCYMQYAMCYV